MSRVSKTIFWENAKFKRLVGYYITRFIYFIAFSIFCNILDAKIVYLLFVYLYLVPSIVHPSLPSKLFFEKHSNTI